MIELTKLPVVALPCLNEDHISVAKIINDLTYRLNDEASTVSELIQRYEALLEHCENHFLCEEFQMQKYHYPALESHQKIHNKNVHKYLMNILPIQQSQQIHIFQIKCHNIMFHMCIYT